MTELSMNPETKFEQVWYGLLGIGLIMGFGVIGVLYAVVGVFCGHYEKDKLERHGIK